MPTKNSSKYIKASSVYTAIGACTNFNAIENFLASEDEVNAACSLLATAVMCVARSCQNRVEKIDYLSQKLASNNKKNGKKTAAIDSRVLEAYNYITDLHTIYVPVLQELEKVGTKVKVRKIDFAEYNDVTSTTEHPAPDPILLLCKAVSNWLILMMKKNKNKDDDKLLLLPVCDVDDTSSECNWATHEEELLARGWQSQMITEIVVPNADFGSVKWGIELTEGSDVTDSDENSK